MLQTIRSCDGPRILREFSLLLQEGSGRTLAFQAQDSFINLVRDDGQRTIAGTVFYQLLVTVGGLDNSDYRQLIVITQLNSISTESYLNNIPNLSAQDSGAIVSKQKPLCIFQIPAMGENIFIGKIRILPVAVLFAEIKSSTPEVPVETLSSVMIAISAKENI